MTTIRDDEVVAGTGWATDVAKGQVLRITAGTIVSFVCFNAHDVTERFDQARTKVYNMRLWASAGEDLYSKLNNPMMRIVSDDFAALGRHDLQLGYGAAELLANRQPAEDGRAVLAEALAPWEIDQRSIPNALNLFHNVEIDTERGAIHTTAIRPPQPAAIEFQASMDLIVAAYAPKDPAAPVHQTFRATILQP